MANAQILDWSIPVNCVDEDTRADEALDRVRDVHVVTRELHGFQHAREELAGAADERQPLGVLVGAGPFADDDQLGQGVAGAEDDRAAALAELAVAAALEPGLLRPQGLDRRRQEVTFEGHRLHPEIAMESEGGGQRAERVGQRRAGRVAQRTAFGAGWAARSARIASRIASATAAFGIRGRARPPPQRSTSSTSLSSASKPMSRRLTSLATSRSMPLASSLARALATTSLVSAAKPTMKAEPARAATSARMSGLGVSASVRSRLPLIFWAAGCWAR